MKEIITREDLNLTYTDNAVLVIATVKEDQRISRSYYFVEDEEEAVEDFLSEINS